MNTEKSILFSTPSQAIADARMIFRNDPAIEWVIASGDGTVSGVLYDGTRGELVLHRSETGAWSGRETIEETQQRILRKLAPA